MPHICIGAGTGEQGEQVLPNKIIVVQVRDPAPPIFSVIFSNILGDITYIGKSSMLPLGHLVPQFDVSFPEKLLKVVATRGEIFFSLKFAKYRLVAGLRPDPLGS